MARKGSPKRAKSFQMIQEYKALERRGFLKIVAAVSMAIVLILGYSYFTLNGVVSEENVVIRGALWITAAVLAWFAGSGGRDINNGMTEIKKICTQTGITKEDIKAYERG